MTKQNTSRLDCIEKNLDLLMTGILDLKESQKQTDAQQKKTEALLAGTIKKLDEVGRQLGD